MNSVIERAQSSTPCGAERLALEDFRQQLEENPLVSVTGVAVEERWKKLSAELARDSKEAAVRPLPRVCVSDQGVVHQIVCCRYTACVWHWAKSLCHTSDGMQVSCRKCSGASIRWGKPLVAANLS